MSFIARYVCSQIVLASMLPHCLSQSALHSHGGYPFLVLCTQRLRSQVCEILPAALEGPQGSPAEAPRAPQAPPQNGAKKQSQNTPKISAKLTGQFNRIFDRGRQFAPPKILLIWPVNLPHFEGGINPSSRAPTRDLPTSSGALGPAAEPIWALPPLAPISLGLDPL